MAVPSYDFEGDNNLSNLLVVLFNSHVHFYQKVVFYLYSFLQSRFYTP